MQMLDSVTLWSVISVRFHDSEHYPAPSIQVMSSIWTAPDSSSGLSQINTFCILWQISHLSINEESTYLSVWGQRATEVLLEPNWKKAPTSGFHSQYDVISDGWIQIYWVQIQNWLLCITKKKKHLVCQPQNNNGNGSTTHLQHSN